MPLKGIVRPQFSLAASRSRGFLLWGNNLNPTLEEIKAAVFKHHGNKSAAARELGVPRETVRDKTRNISLDFPVCGRSTLIDKRTNEPVLEWVKTREPESSKQQQIQAVFDALSEDLPRYKPVKHQLHSYAQDLLSLYVLTDYHLGMLAWGEETGADDWDLRIAEETIVHWFELAISQAPASDVGVFANLGDFLHWDGYDAVTPQHGNLLDADTRFQKLVRTAIRVQRKIIEMLAHKHRRVIVIYGDANHDPASGAWMREWLSAVYQDDPAISIDNSPDSYYCIEHGLTSLFFHHGHKRKVTNVDDVFAAKFRQVFGRTKYSYAHLGHLHSNELKETSLMQIERHRTLAAPDAYASKGGWISGRDAKVITYSKMFGEVSRLIISPDMVRYGQGH